MKVVAAADLPRLSTEPLDRRRGPLYQQLAEILRQQIAKGIFPIGAALPKVVEGETPSGVQRAAAAADFGNGVSTGLPYEGYTFINPDLTVGLVRPPVGEWIGMRTATHYGRASSSTGAGCAESELFDVDGRIGRSLQMLFIDQR